MKDSEKVLIDNLIKDRKYLVSDYMYKRGYEFVSKVLSLPEWNDKKFQPLLTSTIWTSNVETIEKVLGMKEWEDVKFKPLWRRANEN